MPSYDPDKIKAQNPIEAVVGDRVELKKNGNEYSACCPFHNENTPSFTVSPDKGFYHCFGCGAHGDSIDFVTEYEGVTFQEACAILVGDQDRRDTSPEKRNHRQVVDYYDGYKLVPVPEGKEIIPGKEFTAWNPKRKLDGVVPTVTYKPSMVFPYHDEHGDFLGYVIRHDFVKDNKVRKLTPMIGWVKSPDGTEGWSHYPFPKPRPLYNVESLVNDKEGKAVLWVEGEKCADAASLLTAYIPVATCGGTNGIKYTDFSPLKGKRILIWCDNDEVGQKAAEEKLVPLLWSVGVESIKAIEVDSEKPKGWDIADAVDSGMSGTDIIKWAKPRVVTLEQPEYEPEVSEQMKEVMASTHDDKEVVSVNAVNSIQTKDARTFLPTDDGNDVLHALCDQYVYVRSEDCVYRIDEPDLGIKRGAFMFSYQQRPNLDKEQPPVSKLWANDPRRIAVDNRLFTPVPYWIVDNTLNTYRPPVHPEPSGEAETFIEFIDHLIPDGTESAWFLKWLAYKAQNLHERGVAVVMVAPATQGTGRGTLQRVMAQMFGQKYVQNVSMTDVSGGTSQAQYNDWMSESLFAFVAETSEQGHGFKDRSTAYETMKEIVDPAESWMRVKRKGIQNGYERIYCSVLFATNHLDALAIPPEDRRMCVIRNGEKMPDDLWKRIDRWRKNPANIAAALHMLESLNVEDFNFGYAPETSAKIEMIEANKSDLDKALDMAVIDMKGSFFTNYQMYTYIESAARDYDWSLSDKWRTVVKNLVTRKFKKACKDDPRWQLSANGKPVMVYSLHGEQFNKSLIDKKLIREEVMKNGHPYELQF